ncbi:hypothetical protein ACTFIZ_010946 [Dictyostelium cf. discoideum]
MYSLSQPFNYYNDYKFSINTDPISFWDEVATKYVHWDKMYDKVYSGDEMYPDWFKGGELNSCYNLLDRQVQNPVKRDQVALIYECPYLKKTIKLTYYQLYEKVCEFSRVLLNLNISKNDNVLIYMANTVEAPIAMLSCARIGATHCALFDGYSVKSLIDRIETITPKLIITSNLGVGLDEIVDITTNLKEAIELSTFKPDNVITHYRNDIGYNNINFQTKIPNSLNWEEEIEKIKINNQSPFYEYVSVESSHPMYLIYTSGTTGNSKPVVRSNGSNLVGLLYHWNCLSSKVNNDENVVLFSATSVGWVSFHMFFYACLSKGNTFVMFEGGFLKQNNVEDDIWATIEKHNVNIYLALPIVMRYLKKMDPNAERLHSKYDISRLKQVWIGAEVIEKSIQDYIENKLKSESIGLYGQTESGMMYIYQYYSINKTYDTIGIPSPFIKPSILSEDGKELAINEIGEFALKLPLPPGFATTFYKSEEQYKKLFIKFPGYYNSGDLGYKDENGYYGIVSRADDQIKISGNKVQLNSIESSILKHPNVIECCSIGINDYDCYKAPIGILVLKQQESILDFNQLKNEINIIINDDIESYAQLKQIIIVNQLPKTKSGKIQRQILSNFLNNENFKLPDNIENLQLFYNIKHLFFNNSYKNI